MDDVVSQAGWSQASEADRMLFTVLSNAERLDLSSLPHVSVIRPADDEPRIEEVLASIAEDGPPAARDDPPVESSIPGLDSVPFPPPPEPQGAPAPFAAAPLRYAPPPLFNETLPTTPERAPVAPERPPPPAACAQTVADPHRPPPDMSSHDDEHEKRSVLMDLQRLEMQGVRLTKVWTMEDRLEDMTLEMRRLVLAMDERSNVNMMRDGLRMLVTGIEMVSNRIGILDLEGWSSDVCRDLTRHDANLARIYRKYWRRSASNSPEAEIAFAILGSAGMHHMKRSMSRHMLNNNSGRGNGGPSSRRGRPVARPLSPDTSDDEAPPQR